MSLAETALQVLRLALPFGAAVVAVRLFQAWQDRRAAAEAHQPRPAVLRYPGSYVGIGAGTALFFALLCIPASQPGAKGGELAVPVFVGFAVLGVVTALLSVAVTVEAKGGVLVWRFFGRELRRVALAEVRALDFGRRGLWEGLVLEERGGNVGVVPPQLVGFGWLLRDVLEQAPPRARLSTRAAFALVTGAHGTPEEVQRWYAPRLPFEEGLWAEPAPGAEAQAVDELATLHASRCLEVHGRCVPCLLVVTPSGELEVEPAPAPYREGARHQATFSVDLGPPAVVTVDHRGQGATITRTFVLETGSTQP